MGVIPWHRDELRPVQICNLCSRLQETGTKCLVGYMHETGTNYKTGDSWGYITFTSRLFNILLLTFPTGNQFTPVNSEYTNVELYCSKKIINFI